MSLVTTPARQLATCARCAGTRVTEITMTLTDGSVVDFASCHTLRAQELAQAGVAARPPDGAGQGQEAQGPAT